ncbi:hypothetical protein [Alicyclobacillus sp. SP_1]|uniref:hypothetical protein n=1 Tax=Alicyclobacillus sp. SP_1 TaxID=2942475 RepID=UPI00215840DF|nr:hypothetical protein [Alicyclobacillus sp. SP_1]
MSDLVRYGVQMAPPSASTTLLRGILNAWTYNPARPENGARDRSQAVRNACDEALAAYSDHLRSELSRLRRALPEPTRDNPYPPMDGLQAVRELERYLQQVDALRVRIQGAAIPPNDIIGHGRADNRLLFIELESADRDLLQALLELHEHSISVVEGILAHREDILRQFDSHL